jgi:hypothetical protein
MADDGRGQPETTAGLDLGDKYSHLCLLGTESGEVTMVWDYFASVDTLSLCHCHLLHSNRFVVPGALVAQR